jgi:hypothetical protein
VGLGDGQTHPRAAWRGELEEAATFDAVLDPFEVYAHGQSLLRRCLEGLSHRHLRHIALVHRLLDATLVDGLTKEELVDLIDEETRHRASVDETCRRNHS